MFAFSTAKAWWFARARRRRMAPILFHGLSQLGLPVVCIESRQAYQALKSLATSDEEQRLS
jgi:hypothetical protein